MLAAVVRLMLVLYEIMAESVQCLWAGFPALL